MIYLFDSGVNQDVISCDRVYSVTGDIEDMVGHGTSMASVIKSINPKSKIFSVKLDGPKPNLENIISSLEYVDSVDLLDDFNILLFNANFRYDKSLDDFESIIQRLSKKFIIVVPAGNESESVSKFTPARLSCVYNVGSLNKSLSMTSKTNFGDQTRKIDFQVVSTNIDALNRKNQKVKVFGTSVAASVLSAILEKLQTVDIESINYEITSFNQSVSLNARIN